MTLSDEINKMIKTILESSTWTSAGGANPVDNFIKEFRGVENPDLEQLLGQPSGGSQVAGIKAGDPALKPKTGDVGLGLNLMKGEGGASLLGRLGGSGIPQIALAIAVTQMIPLIVKELQRSGGFLDKRVKIIAQEEFFAELDRQTRQNIRIGDEQVIIQQLQGFRASNGFLSTNTLDLVQKNADRVIDIGLFDRAEGMSLGGR